LFGRIINADWLIHLLLAPLFQAVSYAVFKVFGVSLWSARLLTAALGCAILVLFWLLLRRVVSAAVMLVALALLSLDVDFLMLSRVAIPEVPAMLLELGVYAVLVTGRPSLCRTFTAGLLFLATVAMKATTLPMVAIFSAIVLLEPVAAEDRARRWRSFLVFWAGFLTPVLLTAPLYLGFAWRHASAVVSNVRIVEGFVGLSRPYTHAAFPFESDFAAAFNVWALGVCFAVIGWLTWAPEPVEPGLRRYFVTSDVWYGLYTPLMLSTTYFPDRYKVHILVPMAIGIATGLTVIQNSGLSAIREALERMTPGRRALTLGLLVLPTAALWAPAFAGFLGFAGIDQTRLRIKLVCGAVAWIAAVWAAPRQAGAEESGLRFFFVFPVVSLLGWLLAARIGLAGSLWPAAPGPGAGWRTLRPGGHDGAGGTARPGRRIVGAVAMACPHPSRGPVLRRAHRGACPSVQRASALHDEGHLPAARRLAGRDHRCDRRCEDGRALQREPASLSIRTREEVASSEAGAYRDCVPLQRPRPVA